ncbi:MAG: iron ABC transporter permease [Candidatus Cloacimonetes bacterium]|nr:iron ABC transporter permease [Candidatus Cloacimonadota bacterium]
MVKNQGLFSFWNMTKVIVLLFVLMFLIYPFSSMIINSFREPGSKAFSLENFKTFFSLPYYYETLFRSLKIALITMVITLIVGLPIAYLMTRFNVAGKKALHILMIISLMSPPFIGAYSWIILFGRSGVITKLVARIGITIPTIYGQGGIIMVLSLMMYPYIYLYVSGALGSIDSSLEEAAENLGSSKFRRLLTITMPVVLPSILAGAVVVFMTALADFGTPMLLGEGYKVLPVMIYEEYMSEIGGNANLASALSIVIVFLSTLVLMIQRWIIAKRNYVMTSQRPPAVIELHGFKRFLASFPIYLVCAISILPQVTVIVTSFKNTKGPMFVKGFGLESYKSILYRLSKPIGNTYLFSIISIVLIVLFGVLLAYLIVRKKGPVSSLLDTLVMFPYVIPGSVLGICLLIAFNKKPIILTGTAIILIVSYVIRKLPFTVRSSSAFLQQMDPSIEEASVSLGVPPSRTFVKITIPIMAPGIISGAILSWITCINELSSSIMLYTGKTATIAVSIYTEVVRNSFGTAAALASILTASTAISLIIFMKLSKGRVSVV